MTRNQTQPLYFQCRVVELQSHWSDDAEDGIDIFDFELPGNVSNYVISVQFDREGSITEIVMES